MSKAAHTIRQRDQNQLYRKDKKGKYTPVNDPFALDGLSEGWWLVRVQPGSTSARQCLVPDNAEQEAARQQAEDLIVGILHKALLARPPSIPVSAGFQKDWKHMVKKHGHEMLRLEHPSLCQVASEILRDIFSIHVAPEELEAKNPVTAKPVTSISPEIWQ
jgi:hypothetical protein